MSYRDTYSGPENRHHFMARLKPFHSPSTMLDIELAYTLAKFGHRAQKRKELDGLGQPVRYFEHVRRVALILIDEVGIVNSDMVIAALLHDGIEDTRDLTPEMIEHCFGSTVTSLVKLLSKDPKEGYLDRMKAAQDWRVFVLKLCDRLDNVRSLHSASPEFQAKQLKETSEIYVPLFQEMLINSTITPQERRDQIDRVFHRLLSYISPGSSVAQSGGL